jgi:hypothetical protein
MIGGAAARRVAVVVAPVAVALVAVALAPGPGAQAVVRRADPPTGVVVTLTGQAPSAPRAGDTLTLAGTITNRSGVAVSQAQVRLRVSPTPVRNRAELTAILAGTAGRTGIAVEPTLVTVADTLPPDTTLPFTIAVPVDELDLPTGAAVVVLGVESLGDVADDGLPLTQTGFTRTFLPWFPADSPVARTQLVWLFPLTTAPAQSGDGVFLDDYLATEISTRGRLSLILDAAEASPQSVSWVVDPQLLEALSDMADGYEVAAPDGTTVVGGATASAAAWLARLRAVTASSEVTASAYALPDVVALHRAGLDVDIALAATTASAVASTVLGRTIDGGLAWPVNGLTDDGTLDVLRASGARVVVMSSAALPASPEVAYTPSGSVDLATGGSPLRAAVFDELISSLVGAPQPGAAQPIPGGPVVRRQTAVAEIAMTALELPATARTLVIAPSPWWRVDGLATRDLVATVSSPWSTATTLARLVDDAPSDVPRRRADYPDTARAAELPQAYLATVGRQRTALSALHAVAPDVPGTSTSGLESALTRTESGAWRRDLAGGRRLLTSVTGQISAQVDQVTVLSRAPVTLPGDSGVIPVTVANDLDRPARVGVRLTGTPAVRFEATDVPTVTLAPGERVTLEVQARVLGTGPVAVDIALLTPEGEPFGDPVRTEVRSAAYARAAAWVVGGLFAVLVALLGVNLVRRRAGLRKAEATHDADGSTS